MEDKEEEIIEEIIQYKEIIEGMKKIWWAKEIDRMIFKINIKAEALLSK